MANASKSKGHREEVSPLWNSSTHKGEVGHNQWPRSTFSECLVLPTGTSRVQAQQLLQSCQEGSLSLDHQRSWANLLSTRSYHTHNPQSHCFSSLLQLTLALQLSWDASWGCLSSESAFPPKYNLSTQAQNHKSHSSESLSPWLTADKVANLNFNTFRECWGCH